ncbi:FmdB family zinc ribbon protein [Halorussus pelagicus]|nr:hypothetical protein [Halorussus pelagicus]
MGIFRRLAERRRGDDEGEYVCTLCGETFDSRAVVVCPECRGFVERRT